MDFTVVTAASPGARLALTAYVEELLPLLPHGFSVEDALSAALVDLEPPRGLFVVAGDRERPVAGCGLRFLDEHRAELKRMWVSRDQRGTGLGRALLAEMERQVVASGRTTVLLDTNSALAPAVALYDSSGYRRRSPYNDNGDADLWFEKVLVPPADSVQA